jgi:hypothetical protein
MKKFSLLVGALGGALAGYVFSNEKLRAQLSKAKNPEEVAHLLGKHLQKDGKKVGDQVWELVNSEEVQGNLNKAKDFVQTQVSGAKKEVKKQTRKVVRKAKTKAKKAASTLKRKAKKAVKTAKTKAKSTVHRKKK